MQLYAHVKVSAFHLCLATLQAAVGGLLLLGTSNRVLYRMALVPMRDYIVFLAQFQNLFYVIAYFALLWLRYR